MSKWDSHLASLNHHNTRPCYVPLNYIISDNKLPSAAASFKKLRYDVYVYTWQVFPILIYEISGARAALGAKCYPLSTLAILTRRRFPTPAVTEENASVRRSAIYLQFDEATRRSEKWPWFGRFNASGGDACILFRTHREEKQGRLCASGSRNEGQLDCDLPRNPCRSSRYWTRDDTSAATNYRVPPYLFAQLFLLVALTSFRT